MYPNRRTCICVALALCALGVIAAQKDGLRSAQPAAGRTAFGLGPGSTETPQTGAPMSSFGQYHPTPLCSETVTNSQYLAMRDGVRLAATITLPDAASSAGLTFTLKRLTANAVTVASAGGTIDSVATQALAAQYDFITVVSDGTNWYITGR